MTKIGFALYFVPVCLTRGLQRHIFGQKRDMLFKTYCSACIGIDAVTVTVEVDISAGIGIHLVGLPDSAVRESLLRVVTALASYGFRIPGKRLVVNLAPADIRKEGSCFDLAIAVGILAASEQIYAPRCGDFMIMGELALDGRIRPFNGALPAAMHARESGFKGCIFPEISAREAADIDGISIYGVSRLSEVIDILSDDIDMEHLLVRAIPQEGIKPQYANDFRDVKGQLMAKRGLEIAAAGGHNIIMVGSPGSGKSMMASCLPSILPPMTRDESLETSKIYSISGNSRGRTGLMRERPFRAPHHSASIPSLIGGGANASPGEISLAHNGVLYLDEIAQFPRSLLDALRQPLEERKVTISRARYKVTFPASFMVAASMNPCPCGHYGDENGRCVCTKQQIISYMNRISGPVLDRLDLHIWVRSLSAAELLERGGSRAKREEEQSETIAERVSRARAIQESRFAGTGIFCNAMMKESHIKECCGLSDECRNTIEKIICAMRLSARAYSRILKVARTIADLESLPEILPSHLLEAASFRALDRQNISDL